VEIHSAAERAFLRIVQFIHVLMSAKGYKKRAGDFQPQKQADQMEQGW